MAPESNLTRSGAPNGAALVAAGFPIHIASRGIRMAEITDEAWLQDAVSNPAELIESLKSSGKPADILVFNQRLPEVTPKYDFPHDMDNVAAIPISTFDEWITKQVKPATRNKIRKSERSKIVTRVVGFDDELVRGIVALYNETDVRQGRQFWHYGKQFDAVKRENSTYLDRSDFIGAYFQDELVGFLKMVHVGSYAQVMQILSFVKDRDKAPTNALIAKAVEVCAEKKRSHFIYAKYAYGKKAEDSLSEFKRSNGFIKIDIPKYYVPLNARGRLALRLNLHRPITERIPRSVIVGLLAARKWWNSRTSPVTMNQS